MLIQNINLINTKSIIGGKAYSFNDDGIAEIEDKLAQELLKLKGYVNTNPKTKKLAEGKIEPIIDEEVKEKEEIDYEALSVDELKKLIKEKGEKVPRGAKKDDLIEILNK